MNDVKLDWLQFIYVCVLILALGLVLGGCLGVSDVRKEAVTKGKAEYYLDKDNQRQWRWKE